MFEIRRSRAWPTRSISVPMKYTPDAMPPRKKYRMIHQPHSGAATIRPSISSPYRKGKSQKVKGKNVGVDFAFCLLPFTFFCLTILRIQPIDTPNAEREQRRQPDRDRAADAEQRRGQHRPGGQLGRARQPVNLGLVHQQVEGVQAAEDLLVGAVELSLGVALALKLRQPGVGALAQILDWAELDRLGRARLRAGRHQVMLEPIVA